MDQALQCLTFFNGARHLGEMAEPEINAFLTDLAMKEKVGVSALLFLYRHVIGRGVGDLGEVIRARKPKRLPVVMTREEVKAVLSNLTGGNWLMASAMYGLPHATPFFRDPFTGERL